MVVDTAQSAFIAETLGELVLVPLLEADSTTAARPSETGLTVEFHIGDEVDSIGYDGTDWLDLDSGAAIDPGGDDEDLPLWSRMVPLSPETSDAKIGACSDDELADVANMHSELVDLFTMLVASGWKVALTHHVSSEVPSQASVLLHASAPKFDTNRVVEAVAAWELAGVPEVVETAWCSNESALEAWIFDPLRTRVTYVGGTREYIDPLALTALAISVAPAWCLRPGVDHDINRHSTGAPMPPSKLLAPSLEKPPAPTPEEIQRRRRVLAEWSEANGFGPVVQPALPKEVERTLGKLGQGPVGYYLLEFDNGDCYVGQSISIAERLRGHRALRKDIRNIRPRPDSVAGQKSNPLRHLLDQEEVLIHSVQIAGLRPRNKSQMSYLSGRRSLDDVLIANGCTSEQWLADPLGCNASSFGRPREQALGSDGRAGGEEALLTWRERTGADALKVLGLIGSYMRRCLPMPSHTELDYWTLSSPQKIPQWGTLSNLTIGWTEAFRINRSEDGRLSGWLQVNGTELLGEDRADNAVVRFLRQHPGVSLSEARYQAAGPYNLNVCAPNLDALWKLLDDVAVTRAGASAALHLMRSRRSGANRSAHNPILVEAVLSA